MECFLELFCIFLLFSFHSLPLPISKRVEERKNFGALVQGHEELRRLSINHCHHDLHTMLQALIAQQSAQKCWTSAAVCDCNLRHQIWFKSIMQRPWRFHFSSLKCDLSLLSLLSLCCCCCDVVVYIRKINIFCTLLWLLCFPLSLRLRSTNFTSVPYEPRLCAFNLLTK